MDPSQPPNLATDTDRRTRDLPNLTECHSCGFRVDMCTTSGKQKLQPLYSEWRIVLLCNKCSALVESFQICSYCFKRCSSSTDNCLNCGLCKRLVHKTCFAKHSRNSYSLCSGSESPVCVDCWVPKCIAVKREVKVRRNKRRHCSRDFRENVLEDTVKDSSCAVEKKAEVAIRARDLAIRKALAARKAADLAMSALEFFAEFDGSGNEIRGNGLECNAAAAEGNKVVHDDNVMDLKGLCKCNTSLLDENNAGKLAGELCPRYTGIGHEPEVDGCKIVSYPLVYARTRRKAKDDNLDARLEGEGSCSNKVINSNGNDASANPVSPCSVEGDESAAVEDEKSFRKDDHRYQFKYSRRKLNERSIFDSRLNFLCDGLLHEHEALGPALPFNCSKESMTFSNTLPQSYTFSIQTSGCSSGSSRD